MIEIDSASLQVGTLGEQLAVPIRWPVDPQLPAGEVVAFDVTVAQHCSEGRVTGTVLGKLQLRGLDELTSAASPLLGRVREYSLIDVRTGSLAPAAGVSSPIVLRSTSSVTIANAISLNASGKVGGPAGGTGGSGGTGLGVAAPVETVDPTVGVATVAAVVARSRSPPVGICG